MNNPTFDTTNAVGTLHGGQYKLADLEARQLLSSAVDAITALEELAQRPHITDYELADDGYKKEVNWEWDGVTYVYPDSIVNDGLVTDVVWTVSTLPKINVKHYDAPDSVIDIPDIFDARKCYKSVEFITDASNTHYLKCVKNTGDVVQTTLPDYIVNVINSYAVNPILTSGTKIATLSFNDVDYDFYAPTKTIVTYEDSTGTPKTKIGTLTVDGTPIDVYAPTIPSVSYTDNTISLGSDRTKVGTIHVGDTNYDVYVPKKTVTSYVGIITDANRVKIGTLFSDYAEYPIYIPPETGFEYTDNAATPKTNIGTITRGLTRIQLNAPSYKLTCSSANLGASKIKLCTLTQEHNDEVIEIYAPKPEQGGSTVAYTNKVATSSRLNIGTISIDGVDNEVYIPKSESLAVSFLQASMTAQEQNLYDNVGSDILTIDNIPYILKNYVPKRICATHVYSTPNNQTGQAFDDSGNFVLELPSMFNINAYYVTTQLNLSLYKHNGNVLYEGDAFYRISCGIKCVNDNSSTFQLMLPIVTYCADDIPSGMNIGIYNSNCYPQSPIQTKDLFPGTVKLNFGSVTDSTSKANMINTLAATFLPIAGFPEPAFFTAIKGNAGDVGALCLYTGEFNGYGNRASVNANTDDKILISGLKLHTKLASY